MQSKRSAYDFVLTILIASKMLKLWDVTLKNVSVTAILDQSSVISIGNFRPWAAGDES